MNDDKRTHGLWEASAPPAPATDRLEQDIEVDVAVVGGGFTGTSTALHLAQAGYSVCVLEEHEIGFGGSGRNVGLVNAGMWVQPKVVLEQLGDRYGNRLLDVLGNGPDYVYSLIDKYRMECQPVHNGTLHCAVGVSGLAEIRERARQWQALGAPVAVLSAEETAARVGSHAYTGALLDRRAGTIQPLAYARGLAAAALAEGAQIYTQSRVSACEERPDHYIVTLANGRKVRAAWVVVATNAYSSESGLWSMIREELVHLPYFNLATQPLTTEQRSRILPGLEGAWDTCEVLSSYRLDQQGRLIVGSVGALQGAAADIHVNWAKRAVKKLFPQLGEVEFDYEWFGKIGMTGNSLPRLHQLGRNIIAFSGYNGRGISPGTVFGRELARLISGESRMDDMPLPLEGVKKAPYRRSKELYYEMGAQLVHFAAARG